MTSEAISCSPRWPSALSSRASVPCFSPSSTTRRCGSFPPSAPASPGAGPAAEAEGADGRHQASSARRPSRRWPPVRPAVAAAVRLRARWPLPIGPAVAVLGWHRVDVEGGRLAVPPALFARQMEILAERRRRFPVVGIDQAGAVLTAAPAGARRVVLTFDDAWADNHANALGPLSRHRLPATLYVPSRLLGMPGYMTRDSGTGDGRRRRHDRCTQPHSRGSAGLQPERAGARGQGQQGRPRGSAGQAGDLLCLPNGPAQR